MKTMMMVAVSLMMVSGSLAQAKPSTSTNVSIQKMDPNIEENHIVDPNKDKPCPYMTGGRRDKVGIQTAGAGAPAKAAVHSKSVAQ
jgi:hypothetical protein